MKKILIVNSNYYKEVSESLYMHAKKRLELNKFKSSIIHVPGTFEIPFAIRKFINKFDGFIAIGCVIKGETPHFDLICKSTFDALMNLSILYNKPIGNGIITCLNLKQALARSSKYKKSSKKNKGIEAANAVISILKNEPKSI